MFSELRCARERPLRVSVSPRLNNMSVNAKQLEQPDFQSDPSRCKSGHGCHFEIRVTNDEYRKNDEARNPKKGRAGPFEIRNSGFFRHSSFVICHFQRSQGVISSARRSAKAEVRGANPRESANSKPLCLQQLQGEFRKLVFVGASPTRGSSLRLLAKTRQASSMVIMM